MSTTTTTVQPAAFISTKLNYSLLPADGSKPYTHITPPTDPTIRRTNIVENEIPFEVKNLRDRPPSTYDMDQTGFDFLKAPSKFASEYTNWDNEEKIRTEYYDEVIELLKKKTGAHTVQIFDHTIRRTPPKGVVVPDTPETRQPVSRVHVDQTRESATARVRRHLPADQVDSLLQGRFRLINVWRPFHTVYDWPLAVADYRTIDPSKDLTPTDLIYPDRLGEVSTITYNEAHEWWTPFQQEKDEVLLLKCFDNTKEEGKAILTPHTAFKDPKWDGIDGVRSRESIEIRCLVFGGQ